MKSKDEKKKPTKRHQITTKELAFVIAYTCIGSPECGMQAKAAIKAGWAEKDADQQASRLMKKPYIRSAIFDTHKQIMDAALINPSKILADLENTKNLALQKGDLVSANRSIHLMGQYLTMFGDRYSMENDEQTRELNADQKIEAQLIIEVMRSDVFLRRRKELFAKIEQSTDQDN